MDTKINPITWEKFKGVFYDNYSPKVVRERKDREFVDLVQGSMTIEQYATKFIDLSRFGPHLILTEAKKASRFQKGLNDNYAELVKRAMRLEEDFKNNVRKENPPRNLDLWIMTCLWPHL